LGCSCLAAVAAVAAVTVVTTELALRLDLGLCSGGDGVDAEPAGAAAVLGLVAGADHGAIGAGGDGAAVDDAGVVAVALGAVLDAEEGEALCVAGGRAVLDCHVGVAG